MGTKQRRVHLYDTAVRGTPAKARNVAADVGAKARLGTDIGAKRAAGAEASAKTITPAKLAERYLADREDAKRPNGEPAWRPRYYLEVHRHLTKDWKPLAATSIKAIGRQDIVNVIDDIAANQGRVAADRARTALSGLYALAIDAGCCGAKTGARAWGRPEDQLTCETCNGTGKLRQGAAPHNGLSLAVL